jgi:hypothetical protein
MITFATLFLGLTWGAQTVEVVAPPPAARVELLLDGAAVATDAEPPWLFECDLGDEPAPHLLEAVAYDAGGTELARTRQTVNLALPRAEARAVLERADDGRAEAVRLAWQSVHDAEPAAVEVFFDGEPVPVEDPRRIPLPEHDPGALHVVSAELSFAGGAQARADVAFGGDFGEAISTENTAVAVRVDSERALRGRGDAEGLVTVDGEPLPVLAVEHERADLVFVVERSARDPLMSMGWDLREREGAPAYRQETPGPRRLPESGSPRGSRTLSIPRSPAARSLSRSGLRADDRMFLMLPVAAPAPGATPYDLFPLSQPFTSQHGGSAWVLTGYAGPAAGRAGQHLARAVVVAGIHAASGNRPRAVVLVLGPAPDEASPFSPAVARRFLARLRVPLEVWYVEKSWKAMRGDERRNFWKSQEGVPRKARLFVREFDEDRARRRDLAAAGWGTPRDVDSPETLLEEARRLRADLERQRVLWVAGLHLPGDVDLADPRGGVEFLE